MSEDLANDRARMNLCNIHTHTTAEHKGPSLSVFVGDGVSGGYICNDAANLTEEELRDPYEGEGLGSCLSDTCTDHVLRFEAQTFLMVNEPDALDFTTLDYACPPMSPCVSR